MNLEEGDTGSDSSMPRIESWRISSSRILRSQVVHQPIGRPPYLSALDEQNKRQCQYKRVTSQAIDRPVCLTPFHLPKAGPGRSHSRTTRSTIHTSVSRGKKEEIQEDELDWQRFRDRELENFEFENSTIARCAPWARQNKRQCQYKKRVTSSCNLTVPSPDAYP
jgi:hypothetical protein